MAQRKSIRRSSKWRGQSVALLAAILIAAAQLLALAHSHDHTLRFETQPQAAASADLCGLCVLVFHAPLSLSSAPEPGQPQGEFNPAPPAGGFSYVAGSHPFFLTRAPPAHL
jgi:hypothetical protein